MLTCRRLGILAAVTAAAVAAAVGLSVERIGPSQPKGALVFPDLAGRANDVASFQVRAKDGVATVKRAADGAWVVAEKSDYPADADLVKKNVLGLAGMKTVEPKTAKPDLFGRLDLTAIDAKDSGAKLVTLKDKDGKDLAQILIGKSKVATTGDKPGLLYIRRPSEDQTWLASVRLDVAAGPMTWVKKDMPRIERNRVKSVTVVHPDGRTVAASRADAKTEDYQVAGLPDGAKPDKSEVNGLAGALAFPSFDDVKKADAVSFDKAVKTTVTAFDGLSVTAEIAQANGKSWARFRASAEGGKDPATKEAETVNKTFGAWAYQLPDYQAKDLTKKPEDLVAKPKDEKK